MAAKAEGGAVVGVGVGAHAGHDVAQMQLVGHRPGGADADDVLHAVEVVQLVGIDADGRHAHARGHDADALALPGAGVAVYAAHVVDQLGVGEVGVGDEFGAQRVAGHQYGAGEVAGLAADVRGGVLAMIILLLRRSCSVRSRIQAAQSVRTKETMPILAGHGFRALSTRQRWPPAQPA